jgi:HEAT repeat protein
MSEHADDVAEAMDQLRSMPDQAHDAVAAAMAEHRGSQPNLARLLGEWGRPESVPLLRDAVERGGHSLRYAAGMALAGHSDPTAAQALTELARSTDPDVAHMAALALAERKRAGK